MSPEQARGRAVDKRTDIWAFGCVLYEMLTGGQAFGGDGVAEVLASVIRAEPDWNALPGGHAAGAAAVPAALPAEGRASSGFHDIGDVRLAMDGAFERRRRTRRAWPAAIAWLGVGRLGPSRS